MSTWHNNFNGRVEWAGRCIMGGRTGNEDNEIGSRKFDSCFENHDGAIVVCTLWREALRDRMFMSALLGLWGDRQLPEVWQNDIAKFAEYSDEDLPKIAAKMRRDERANAKLRWAEWQSEQQGQALMVLA